MKIDKEAMKQSLAIAAEKLKFKAPDISMVVGTGLIIGGTVTAGTAGIRAAEVIEWHKSQRDIIRRAEEFCEDPNCETEYTEEDKRNDIFKVYKATAVKLGKKFAVPIALTAGGLGCVWWSHGEMGKRNAALGVAVASARKAFENYRENVRNEGGEELDRHYMFGTEKKDIEIMELDETGAEKLVEKIESAEVAKEEEVRRFAKMPHQLIFSRQTSSAYTGNPEFDMNFLRHQEHWAAQIHLPSAHVLSTDEVAESLGIQLDGMGYLKQRGWVYKPEAGLTDYVEFKVTPIYQECTQGAYAGEVETVYLIELNDRDYIIDLI